MVPPTLTATVSLCVSSCICTSFSCFSGFFFSFQKMHCFQRKDKAWSNYCNLWSKLGQCPRQIQLRHRIATRLMIWGNLRLHECAVPGRGWNHITTLFFLCRQKQLEVNHRRALCLRVDLMNSEWTAGYDLRFTEHDQGQQHGQIACHVVCVRVENMNSVGRNAF